MNENPPALSTSIGLAALALSFLLPGHYMPWVSFQQQALAALAVLVLAGVALRQAGASAPWPRIAMCALALAAVPLLQWAGGQVRFFSDALLPSAYLAGFAVAVVTGVVLGRAQQAQWINRLFVAFIAAAALSTLLALFQWLRVPLVVYVAELPPHGRPFANLAQPNHLATLCLLGLVGVLQRYESGLMRGRWAAVVSAWLLFGVLLTQSRTALLGLGLLLCWWALKRRQLGLRLTLKALGWAALAVVFGLVTLRLAGDLLGMPGASLQERLQPGPRLQFWHVFWEASLKAPLLGYGWNQISFAHLAVALDQAPLQRMTMSAHNLGLDLALYMGWPLGLLAFFGLFWQPMRHAWRTNCSNSWALVAACGALLLHALFEYPLEYLYFLLPLGLLVGSLKSLHPEPMLSLPRLAQGALLLALAVLSYRICVEYLPLERMAREARLAVMGIGQGPDRQELERLKLLDGPRDYVKFWSSRAQAQLATEQLEWMKDVVRRNPTPPALLRYALAAGLNGQPKEAELTLKRLCSIQLPQRCEEGREAWLAARKQFPALRNVQWP
ncbi:MAG: Wzy polymerase domain-containing protein [Inhella sp.]